MTRPRLLLLALLLAIAPAASAERGRSSSTTSRASAGQRGEPRYDYTIAAPRNTVDAFQTLLASGTGYGKVRRFSDQNPMTWNAFLDVVASARPGKTLKSSFFTTEKDAYGWSYLGGLLYAQMRGVEVTHLNDWSANARGRGFTSYGLGYSVLQELARYGSKVGVFNTPLRRLKYLLKHGLSYGVIGCNHDKVVVANAETPDAQGLNGGRNVGKAYFQAPEDNPQAWRDDTIQVKGNEACHGYAHAVDRELDAPAMKRVKPPRLGFGSRAREMLAAYALMQEWVERAPLSKAEKTRLRGDPQAQAKLATEVLAASSGRLDRMIAALPAEIQKTIPRTLGGSAAKNLGKLAGELSKDLELCGTRAAYQRLGGFMAAKVKIVDQTGAADAAPGERFNEMVPDLRHLLHGVQKSALIINPYVVLTEAMVQRFEEGARRGVKYTIVTNSPMSTDSAITQGFFLNNWANVMARVPTMRVMVATGKRKIHAKAFVVDGVVSGDTTFNADLLSALVNGEMGTISLSRRVAAALTSDIEKDLANPANGFKEWSIQKDARGRAVLDARGRPIVLHGPEDDLSWWLRAIYRPVRWLCQGITCTRSGAPLRLQQAKDVLAREP